MNLETFCSFQDRFARVIALARIVVLCCVLGSLRSKRSRGIWEQRKTEERDFRCFSHAKNGARAKNRQRTELAIGWDRRILLTCVDQRTQTCEAIEGCLRKALIFPHRTRVD